MNDPSPITVRSPIGRRLAGVAPSAGRPERERSHDGIGGSVLAGVARQVVSLVVTVTAIVALVACSGGGGTDSDGAGDDAAGSSAAADSGSEGGSISGSALAPRQFGDAGGDERLYSAEWIVDAEAIGREGPGYPYRYVELVDDRNGRYLVTGPEHLALQEPAQVVFCAGIWLDEPRCASTERPENTPNVLALGLATIREWHPEELYEVANWRRMELVAESSPGAWDRSVAVVQSVVVDCFRSIDPDEGTPDGLELCYTSDENRLLASVDMNGDEVHEVFLDRYDRFVDPEEIAVAFDTIDDSKLYEQLLVIFPEVPVTATPIPVDEDGNPILEGAELGADDNG